MGLRAHASGDLEAAKLHYEKVLAIDPTIVSANGWLGTIEAQKKNFSRARVLLERALAGSKDPDFLLNYANLLQETREYERALIVYLKVVKKRRNQVSLSNLAACHNELNHPEQGLRCADQSLAIDPNYADAWSNRGIALNDLKRYEEALASYDRAIGLKLDYAEAWSNRGVALNDLKRHEEALASYDRAIEIKPDYAEALYNRGVVLNDLKRHEEALSSYDRAIELKPDYSAAWSNRGIALNDLWRHEEAVASYRRSIELKPNADYILGALVHTQMKICDWTDHDERCQALKERLLIGDRASVPFAVLGLFNDPSLQRRCAELHAQSRLGFKSQLWVISKRSRGDKIRVGYFSMDFREHPVANLMAELIEIHDRNRFETFGFSFGMNTGDAMRKRLESAFDNFLEIRHLSELDIARLSRDLEIDIAIDLGGYTQDSRPAIFAHRAAPIQINYLGFPGTMGSPVMDYLIADPVLIPESLQSAYSEKILYLPNSYQVNDSKRLISDKVFTREEVGLPRTGFVFCCFNNNWKILPEIFDAWVQIIRNVPNSVLWLYEDNPTAARNLQVQAKRQNLDPSRLVFAKRMPNAEHLARHRLADLFLDTSSYGAHTTASDALWAGLPVLTRSGQSFASRVATSLLHAVGLPELITDTTEEYESLAIRLANNPEIISSLKVRLAQNRTTCPLFNTALFTQHIELAYQAAYDRHHDGLAPDHIFVNS